VVALALALLAVGGLVSGERASADDPKKAGERTPLARFTSPAAVLVQRDAPRKKWEVVKPNQDIYDETLLVGATGVVLDSKSGAVRSPLCGVLEGRWPLPIKTWGIVLHQNPAVDLDFTLERGRADLTNRKEKGPTTIRVRVREQPFDVTLLEP